MIVEGVIFIRSRYRVKDTVVGHAIVIGRAIAKLNLIRISVVYDIMELSPLRILKLID